MHSKIFFRILLEVPYWVAARFSIRFGLSSSLIEFLRRSWARSAWLPLERELSSAVIAEVEWHHICLLCLLEKRENDMCDPFRRLQAFLLAENQEQKRRKVILTVMWCSAAFLFNSFIKLKRTENSIASVVVCGIRECVQQVLAYDVVGRTEYVIRSFGNAG